MKNISDFYPCVPVEMQISYGLKQIGLNHVDSGASFLLGAILKTRYADSVPDDYFDVAVRYIDKLLLKTPRGLDHSEGQFIIGFSHHVLSTLPSGDKIKEYLLVCAQNVTLIALRVGEMAGMKIDWDESDNEVAIDNINRHPLDSLKMKTMEHRKSCTMPRFNEFEMTFREVNYDLLVNGNSCVCTITMENFHLVTGVSYLFDPSKPDLEKARKAAYSKAIDAAYQAQAVINAERAYRSACATLRK